MARGRGASAYHIDLGKPWPNSYGESFNNRLRDQRLNITEFWSINHARVVLETWGTEYNTGHLHSFLGYQTLEELAASWSAA